LAEVFGHLIQNAQESAGISGSVNVTLNKSRDGFVVNIEDNGPGMSQEFIDTRLFKAFDTTKGLTGMGIGVFESREYIRSIGGDILVSSQPNKLTRFQIVLPQHYDLAKSII